MRALHCHPLRPEAIIHAQADGEWIGGLPIAARLIPDALSLLVPRHETASTFN